ncbi:hypothetical protein [Companilactobacillus keshanensis]|uniref:DUF1642 domain-containing protein n=1 Tax=Companilactobacillus keshanensis TaxID=2486003 RepID=A0ABW4BWR9_9LACO|nr:hypothetical protein [Companilactobacillus keshanensis]
MSKRQLRSKYKELVDHVESYKADTTLFYIIQRLYYNDDPNQRHIADRLCDGLATSYDFDELIPIVTDIYNDNYELEGPKYAWRFLPINGELNQLFLGNFYNTKPDLFTQNEFDQFIKDNDYLNSEMFKREEM